MLFEVENYLRMLVRWELRKDNPLDWAGRIPKDLVDHARERRAQEAEIGFLDVMESGLLSYLNLSELKDILLGALWENVKRFRPQWPPLEVLQAEFKKLIAIRNKTAHFRSVTERDARVALRFAEDLSEWSAALEVARLSSRAIPGGAEESEEAFIGVRLPGLVSAWRELRTRDVFDRHKVVASCVDRYFVFSVAVVAGSVNPALFLEFIRKHERLVPFFLVGSLGDRVSCYFPWKLGGEEIAPVVLQMADMVRYPVDGMSSASVRREFKFSEREDVLPWEEPLPMKFAYLGCS